MENKLTDNEIVKALECCVSEQYTCRDCPYQEIKHYSDDEGFEIMPNGKRYDDWSCERWLNVDLLDLISRQKAEIERLQNSIAVFTNNAVDFANEIDRHKKDKEEAFLFAANIVESEKIVIANAKAEAYKECIEKVKEKSKKTEVVCSGALITTNYAISAKNLNNLLKELVGDNNA